VDCKQFRIKIELDLVMHRELVLGGIYFWEVFK